MRLLLACLLLFLGTYHVQAIPVQKTATDTVQEKTVSLKIDSSKVEVRKFDEQAIKDYSKQKDFIYDDVPEASTTWWDRFWRWIWWLLDKIFGGSNSRKSDGSFVKAMLFILKWVLIIAVVILLIYVVFKILGLDLKWLTGKSKSIDVPYEESLENIHEINFDEQLENAISNANYRLAVRLLYLKTLKNLSDKELIFWQPEKTNQAYILEIKNENQQEEFKKLTHKFEYIWYGEFFIDLVHFEAIHESFHHFNEKTK